MKKILLSLSIVLAVAAIVVGGTYAYFSDSSASTGNTFSAGTLVVKLSDDNEIDKDAITASFGNTGLYPGAPIPEQNMTVKNGGSINGDHLYLQVTLPTGNNTDLAKNIYLDGANGLRFGTSSAPDQSANILMALLGSAGPDEYTVLKKDGTVFAPTDVDNDGGVQDGKISLQELANFSASNKIRINKSTLSNGMDVGTSANLYFTGLVGTGLVAQGQTVKATFTWTIVQDATQ